MVQMVCSSLRSIPRASTKPLPPFEPHLGIGEGNDGASLRAVSTLHPCWVPATGHTLWLVNHCDHCQPPVEAEHTVVGAYPTSHWEEKSFTKLRLLQTNKAKSAWGVGGRRGCPLWTWVSVLPLWFNVLFIYFNCVDFFNGVRLSKTK